jgi:hypothetical protein
MFETQAVSGWIGTEPDMTASLFVRGAGWEKVRGVRKGELTKEGQCRPFKRLNISGTGRMERNGHSRVKIMVIDSPEKAAIAHR